MESIEKSACLAILNYNGRPHLKDLLPTAVQAVRNYGRPCPIIVLDNQSSEGDVSWLRQNYPGVDVVISPKNDFLFSYNWLLSQRLEDTILLLNNDLKLSENFIEPLVRHFADPSVFAVSCKAYDWTGDHLNSGPCFFKIRRRGWFATGFQEHNQVLSYTLFSSGGYMAVDRRKFLELEGFDRLFHPAYGEDKDLCFRAWCRGWKSLYEPECHVFHREGGSWDSQGKKSRNLIAITDFLFMWRNLRDLKFRMAHQMYLAWLIARKRAEGDAAWLAAFSQARRLWRERRGQALSRRPHTADLKHLQQICGAAVHSECNPALLNSD